MQFAALSFMAIGGPGEEARGTGLEFCPGLAMMRGMIATRFHRKAGFGSRLLAVGMLSAWILGLPWSGQGQQRIRTELTFPNLPDYLTLKCDFHMHTVFSDGNVWPTVRADEAWRDGLDVLAITDHIEYVPHRDDIAVKHGRAYELAKPMAEGLDLILIQGAEITRGEPPGHLNAIFLRDVPALQTEKVEDAVQAAVSQGAFVFWNHPGWKQPQQKSVWYDQQDHFYRNGWLQGIEVVNGDDYDPIAHQWCLDKQLTMMGDSDVHDPIWMNYDASRGQHRPVTLVFARERTVEGVREALFGRRTAVYWQDRLIGEAAYLRPLFEASLEYKSRRVNLAGRTRAVLQIHNRAPIDFVLEADGRASEATATASVTLAAGKTSMIEVRPAAGNRSGVREVRFPYRARNLWIAPNEGLPVELAVSIDFGVPKKAP